MSTEPFALHPKTIEDFLYEANASRLEFGEAITVFSNEGAKEKDRKKAAAKMEDSIDVVLRYLRKVSLDRPSTGAKTIDVSNKKELLAVTLQLAVHVQSGLTQLMDAEHSAMVKVDYASFRYNLEKDLLRLKDMSHHLR